MGHWDYQAIELKERETPENVLQALPSGHGFHLNGTIHFRSAYWLHLGWNDANVTAYKAIVRFCQVTDRRWITSYAQDPRAELDIEFFGKVTPPRDERLEEIFGPPEKEKDRK